jgi:hypothetical protein
MELDDFGIADPTTFTNRVVVVVLPTVTSFSIRFPNTSYLKTTFATMKIL